MTSTLLTETRQCQTFPSGYPNGCPTRSRTIFITCTRMRLSVESDPKRPFVNKKPIYCKYLI